jgi:hypothetical protein
MPKPTIRIDRRYCTAALPPAKLLSPSGPDPYLLQLRVICNAVGRRAPRARNRRLQRLNLQQAGGGEGGKAGRSHVRGRAGRAGGALRGKEGGRHGPGGCPGWGTLEADPRSFFKAAGVCMARLGRCRKGQPVGRCTPSCAPARPRPVPRTSTASASLSPTSFFAYTLTFWLSARLRGRGARAGAATQRSRVGAWSSGRDTAGRAAGSEAPARGLVYDESSHARDPSELGSLNMAFCRDLRIWRNRTISAAAPPPPAST